MSVFYNLQINTAKRIICSFLYSVRNVILIAQMQSGKTHTALYTALTMLKDKHVQNIVIFSGISEITLKKQWIDSTNECIDYFEKKYNITINQDSIHIVW